MIQHKSKLGLQMLIFAGANLKLAAFRVQIDIWRKELKYWKR